MMPTKTLLEPEVTNELKRVALLPLVKEVAAEYLVPVQAILGRGRTKRISQARQEVWRRIYAEGFSLPEIGQMFGRHHTSILYGIRRVDRAVTAVA